MTLTDTEANVLDAAQAYTRKWETDPLRVSYEGQAIIRAVRLMEGLPPEWSPPHATSP